MIKRLALDLHDQVFKKLRLNALNVFFVGGVARYRQTLRDSIKSEFNAKLLTWFDENRRYFSKRISVYYPEELFEELIRGKGGFDLLSLENLLAQSVHVIVIVLESPGAIAELGAFTNHPQLSNRLVVVVDKKFRKARSFIALGPIRYLKRSTLSLAIK